jgi:hypothetical protein
MDGERGTGMTKNGHGLIKRGAKEGEIVKKIKRNKSRDDERGTGMAKYE